MKIPRKIDDKLKNAVVQFQFVSNIPSGTILGYFYSRFKNEVRLIPPLKMPLFSSGLLVGVQESTQIIINLDNNFTIDLKDNSITFDLADGYKGWDLYMETIEKYMFPLFEHKIVSSIEQIGVRYISNFDNVLIYDHIKGIINLELIESATRGQSRFEFNKNKCTIGLNLINGAVYEADNKTTDVSIIDIHAVQKVTIKNTEELVDTTNKMHDIEKEVFFSLLKDEFLATLNPEY